MDRDFPVVVKLCNGMNITGVSLYRGRRNIVFGKQFRLVFMGSNLTTLDPRSLCLEGTLDPQLVVGKIVICDCGVSPRVQKGQVVKDAGGVSMILANTAADGEELVADAHLLPAVAVGETSGKIIKHYSSTTPTRHRNLNFQKN